jgi:hypothetical protein
MFTLERMPCSGMDGILWRVRNNNKIRSIRLIERLPC